MLLSDTEARDICDALFGHVKADDASIAIESGVESHFRFAANAFTTNGRREDTNITLTVWIDRKRGAASVNDTAPTSIRAMVEEAEGIARLSPVDREYVPTLSQQQYTPVNGYEDATANVGAATRAAQISGVIGACEKAGVIGAGFHQANIAASASATKSGNFSYQRSSLVSLAMTARTPDGGSSGYFLRNHFDVARLDTARIAREAIRRALESRNPRTLPAGVYPVILEPQAVADLLRGLPFAFDARNADEGRSAFAAPGGKTKAGQQVFDERISFYSDPWHPELPGSQAAQSGVPARKVHLVRNGIIDNLVYSRFWAQQKGKTPTPGPVNAVMQSSARPANLDEMVKATDRGLLVGRFWYIRMVDPRTLLFTGLTRDGVWYIEKGTIQHPVRNFRFNQSILQMLAQGNVEMIGASERVSASESQGDNAALLPALKLKAFNFTSQSEAV